MYTVYIHTNKVNHKCYIGATKQETNRRWNNGFGYRTQARFFKEIEEFGWENFEHIVFAEGLTKDKAEQMERCLIALYNTTDPLHGYNVSAGSKTTGVRPDAKARQRMSDSHKGKKQSAEQIQKRIAHFMGEKHWLYGKHWDDATKEKMRQAKLGRKLSPEHIAHLSEAQKKPIVCVETGQWYDSYKAAAADLNISRSKISDFMRGVRKSVRGYHFVLADDNYKIVASHDGSRCFVDRKQPRTEIYIEEYEE